jgi:UDP-N-acetylmuramyl pentapeptide phosphotransferase/UDP-N-acetylglucosamine-1-phosphate transferase
VFDWVCSLFLKKGPPEGGGVALFLGFALGFVLWEDGRFWEVV